MELPEKKTTLNRFLFVIPALLAGLLFASMVSGAESGERLIVLRYFLFGYSGLAAFILPYLSFPDRRTPLIQIVNLSPTSILKLYLKRHSFLWATGLLLVLVIACGNPFIALPDPAQAGMTALGGVLVLAGVYLFAAARYLKSGTDSQLWKEGGRGEKTKKWLADVGKYPVDPGSVPSLLNSVVISLFGMLGVVAGAAAGGYAGVAGEALVALLIFLYGVRSIIQLRATADHHFYHSNAFFYEFFGEGRSGQVDREPIRVGQLWWIPTRWKVHSWALMLELDRRIPSGRLIGIGHLFVWVLAYQRLAEPVLLVVWILFALSHHSLLIFTTQEALAPRWWLRHLDRAEHWAATRFWIQVRWLLPLLISIIVMKSLFGIFSWQDVWLIALVYLASGALFALVAGALHERRWV
ncbi:MAG: hypothetical protein WD355_02860 [Balneolaceae bacterium]